MVDLNDVIKVHGNTYEYDANEFPVANRGRITVTCGAHGVFTQRVDHHLSGHGCPECGKIRTALSRKLGTTNILERFAEVHGNTYSYNVKDDIKLSDYIDIDCPVHGIFSQAASDHIAGKGCKQCALSASMDNTESFIAKATFIHGDTYDYTDTHYIDNNTQVVIKCKVHGSFLQTPRIHKSGSGCQSCGEVAKQFASYKRANKATKLYIVYFTDLKLWKIGVTARSLHLRLSKISPKYQILFEQVFSDAKTAYEHEQRLLYISKCYIANTSRDISGYTELRDSNPLELQEVQQYLQQLMEA